MYNVCTCLCDPSSLMHKQGEVMDKVAPQLDEAVCQWPRLGYLTQHQRLKALACRGDLLPIIPLINRVFTSIKTLQYLETASSPDSNPRQYTMIKLFKRVKLYCLPYRLSGDWSGGRVRRAPISCAASPS